MKKILLLGVFSCLTLLAHAGNVQILEANGWLESAYVKFSPVNSAKTYNVYVKGGQYADFTKIDAELVRNYGSYGRADVVGLQAGTYTLKIVPVSPGGAEIASQAATTSDLEVLNYSREGFAFMNGYAPGAYNSDGTLKAGAKVFYVTKNTAKTITTTVKTGSKATNITTCTGIQTIIDAYQKGYDTTPIAFRFIGLITVDDLDRISSSAEGLQIKGRKADSELNITIEGIGDDATVRGFGFLVRNAKGVEFRNFAIMRCMDDCISLDTDNSNIWIHHTDQFYGKHGSGDHAKGDGATDVKSDSKYVSVSYNRFWDTGKSNMFGMTSESGPNYISYDHNWFDHSDSRHPRVRTMSVHVWNNYFDNVAKYGIGATTGSSVFVENNYFLKTKKPILSSLQGTDGMGSKGTFSGEDGGMIKAYGNYMDKTAAHFSYYNQNNPSAKGYDAYETATRDEQVPSTEKTLVGGTTYNNFDTDASLMYTYTPVDAADVPALVTGYYGAGRLNHGDFSYTFPDNVGNDDTDSAYDTTLGSMLDNYQSSLVGFFGDATAITAEIGATGWATFWTDVPLDFSGVTGLKAYVVTGHEGNAVTTTQMTGIVAANTALLLEGATAEIPFAASSSASVSANKLVAGTGAAVDAGSGVTRYVLSADGATAVFKKINATAATVPYGNAYLEFTGSVSAPMLAIGGETTGVETIDLATPHSLGENGQLTIDNYYDLQGRRVAQPTKGLYIVNGRKVVIK